MSGPSKKFFSKIGSMIMRYIDLKKALGQRTETLQYQLAQLDRFLTAECAADLDLYTFASWCKSIELLAANTRRQRMRMVYHLCLFRRRYEPACFLPDPSQFPPRQPLSKPHIFSETEIALLLYAVYTLQPHPCSPLHRSVARLAIVLLYTAGLRRGELANLCIGDYSHETHTLLIRRTKFYKSRLVPLSNDAVGELRCYLEERERSGFSNAVDSPLLIHRHGGETGYSGMGLGQLLHKVIRHTDIRTAAGRSPRVHDLRFSFAVHALLRWYRAGVDVQARLPALSTYMGHVSILSTQYYLVLLDEVIEAASERFEAYCSDFVPKQNFEVRDSS